MRPSSSSQTHVMISIVQTTQNMESNQSLASYNRPSSRFVATRCPRASSTVQVKLSSLAALKPWNLVPCFPSFCSPHSALLPHSAAGRRAARLNSNFRSAEIPSNPQTSNSFNSKLGSLSNCVHSTSSKVRQRIDNSIRTLSSIMMGSIPPNRVDRCS